MEWHLRQEATNETMTETVESVKETSTQAETPDPKIVHDALLRLRQLAEGLPPVTRLPSYVTFERPEHALSDAGNPRFKFACSFGQWRSARELGLASNTGLGESRHRFTRP